MKDYAQRNSDQLIDESSTLTILKQQLFILFQYIVPQHLLSRLVGWFAETEITWLKNSLITMFVKHFKVDMSLAKIPEATQFPTFNAFFTRELRAEARPVDNDPKTLACPADGAISQLGKIAGEKIFQAKGQHYTVYELLGGDNELAQQFLDGTFATIYLSPKDYHRVHMPLDGTLKSMIHVPGDLFSVNTVTAQNVPRLFARNERVIAIFDTVAGPMAVVLVGAMIVASIETVWAGQVTPKRRKIQTFRYDDPKPIVLKKGEEMGRFQLGSTVIICFAPNAITWLESFTETTVTKMGQALGQLI